jgi:hypothetical protein
MLRGSATVLGFVLRRNLTLVPRNSVMFCRNDLFCELLGSSLNFQIRGVATAMMSPPATVPPLKKTISPKKLDREKKEVRVYKELTIEEYMRKLKSFHEKQSFQGFRTLLKNLGSNSTLLTQLSYDQKFSILSMIETIALSLKGESLSTVIRFMGNVKYPVDDVKVQKTLNLLMLSLIKDKKFPFSSLSSLLVGLTKVEWQLERLKNINYEKEDFIQFLTRVLDQQSGLPVGTIKDKEIVTILFQLSKLGVSKEDLSTETQAKLLSLAKSAFELKEESNTAAVPLLPVTAIQGLSQQDHGRQISNLIYALGSMNFTMNDLSVATSDKSKEILIKSLESHLNKMSMLQISMVLYG